MATPTFTEPVTVQQPVDGAGNRLVGINFPLRHKPLNLIGSGWQSNQVEAQTTQQRSRIGIYGRLHVVSLKFGKHQLIDWAADPRIIRKRVQLGGAGSLE